MANIHVWQSTRLEKVMLCCSLVYKVWIPCRNPAFLWIATPPTVNFGSSWFFFTRESFSVLCTNMANSPNLLKYCDWVTEIPTIEDISGNTIVDLGDDLDLECRVEGHPTPLVTWSHNGQPVHATQDGRWENFVKCYMVLPHTVYACHLH